jgi:hypothetical protein
MPCWVGKTQLEHEALMKGLKAKGERGRGHDHEHQLVQLEDGDTSDLDRSIAQAFLGVASAGVARQEQRERGAGVCEARAGAEVAGLQQQGQQEGVLGGGDGGGAWL